MYICVNCGVELEDELRVCPLCGTSSDKNAPEDSAAGSHPSDIIQMYREERRKHFWELTGVIAFSGVAVCTIIDLVLVKGIRWSSFADISIIAAWMILSLFFYTIRKPAIFLPALLAVVLSMLFLFDLFSPNVEWFFRLGLPVTLAACISLSIVVVFYKAGRFRGFNIIGVSLLCTSIFCIISEFFIDLYLNGKVQLRWSLIEGVSVLPVALIYFFIHYRLKKGNRLDSFFHV
jgi:hypothetical protein